MTEENLMTKRLLAALMALALLLAACGSDDDPAADE
jgi:major membrane immunogen (membrane-anchored lipoprotein)